SRIIEVLLSGCLLEGWSGLPVMHFLFKPRAMKLGFSKFLLWLIWIFQSLFIFGCAHGTKAPLRAAMSTRNSEVSARIVIDPGHGGQDSGAVGRRGLLEKEITLDIARRLERLVKRYLPNVDVLLTRRTDRFVSLED